MSKTREFFRRLWNNKTVRGFLAGMLVATATPAMIKHGVDPVTASQIGQGMGEVIKQLPNE